MEKDKINELCREELRRVEELEKARRAFLKGKAQYGNDVEVYIWSSEKEDYVNVTFEEIEEELKIAKEALKVKRDALG